MSSNALPAAPLPRRLDAILTAAGITDGVATIDGAPAKPNPHTVTRDEMAAIMGSAPALLDWTQATEAQLIAEFERRALLGLTKPLPASLLERIEAQLALMPLADQAPALQAWHWILHGEGPPPVPQLFR